MSFLQIGKSKIRPANPEDGVVWITGASSGIGYALALQLAANNWQVIVSARNQEALEELAKQADSNIHVLPLDVTHTQACKNAVEQITQKHGKIALAILNAGVYLPVEAATLSVEVFDKSFDVNLRGVVNCLVPVSQHMRDTKTGDFAGQIAVTSSVAGYTGLPTSAAYGATKAGLINMCESLRLEFEQMGVLLQLANPGFVDTPATKENSFEMPALMSVEKAANRLAQGLEAKRFEITFPRRFTYALKIMRILPYWAYFFLVGKMTGVSK